MKLRPQAIAGAHRLADIVRYVVSTLFVSLRDGNVAQRLVGLMVESFDCDWAAVVQREVVVGRLRVDATAIRSGDCDFVLGSQRLTDLIVESAMIGQSTTARIVRNSADVAIVMRIGYGSSGDRWLVLGFTSAALAQREVALVQALGEVLTTMSSLSDEHLLLRGRLQMCEKVLLGAPQARSRTERLQFIGRMLTMVAQHLRCDCRYVTRVDGARDLTAVIAKFGRRAATASVGNVDRMTEREQFCMQSGQSLVSIGAPGTDQEVDVAESVGVVFHVPSRTAGIITGVLGAEFRGDFGGDPSTARQIEWLSDLIGEVWN